VLLNVRFVRAAFSSSAVALAIFTLAGTANAASGVHVLANFHGSDGAYPTGGAPALDKSGNVYLPTYDGGPDFLGDVVMISPGQDPAVLHNFNGADGTAPIGGVLLSKQSMREIFGTTCEGGANGYGVLYALHLSGKETVLHSFDFDTDGACPIDAPVRDPVTSAFYGVANYGGAGDGSGYGTVWKLSPEGVLTVLHTFGFDDGGYPAARLIRGKDGTLYGVTSEGGVYGYGTIFAISADGAFATLHSFDNNNDGAGPQNFLTQDKDGNLYGTAYRGGTDPDGAGTVYKLEPDGAFTVLHSFGRDSGGAYPESNLLLLNEKLYGSTSDYGNQTCRCGTIFEVGLDGTFAVLHTLGPDAARPFAGLTRGPHQYLYGDTKYGGTDGYGAVFRIRPQSLSSERAR
jgi:uncharacterized repeat protein (TIGR03803 family)